MIDDTLRVFVIMGSFMPGKAIPPEIDEDAKTSQRYEHSKARLKSVEHKLPTQHTLEVPKYL